MPSGGRCVDPRITDLGLQFPGVVELDRVDWRDVHLRRAGFDEKQAHLTWTDSAGTWTAVVEGADLIQELRSISALEDQWRSLSTRRGRRRAWAWMVLGILLAIPFVLLALYAWQAERIAAWIANRVPAAQERQLGKAIFTQLSAQLQLKEPAIPMQALTEIGGRLTRGSTYRYRWYIADDPEVNAFAVPGGIVVVYTGLLNSAGSAEEVAGVLAHEIEHVERKHSLKNMIYSLGLHATLSLAFGNIDQHWGTRLAEQLGQLRFSREQESEADSSGLRRLRQAHIDPKGMQTFFERLSKEHPDTAPVLLATHPHTADRLANIKQLLIEIGPWPIEALPYDWSQIRATLH